MTGALVPSSGRPDPLASLALASTGGTAAQARTSLEAIQQAHALFSGVYAQRWLAAQNAQVSWAVVLGDATPGEIAVASLRHVRDTRKREDGQLECDWPPTPGSILARVREAREKAARDASFREAQERNRALYERPVTTPTP